MSIDLKVPNWLNIILRTNTVLLYLLMPLIFYMLSLVFVQVPNERLMGPVQRIFYVHVGCAVACYISFAVVFLCSVGYLFEKNYLLDLINEAAAEVGFLFCSIVLFSGMIWGHSAWNTWFSWEPRLVTFLLLWLIFLGFIFLRMFGNPSQLGKHSAVLGIIGTVMVPIMVYSIKFWPSLAQLHPEVVAKGGLHPDMSYALIVAIITMVVLQFVLLIFRIRLGIAKQQVLFMES